MCRLGLVAPKMVHKAGFHPTAVVGAMGAAAAGGRALRLNAGQLVDAFGIAGSMASGIIEYLAEGAHGFFHGFANTLPTDFGALIGDFGSRWMAQALAFKLYPCGTMTHPYID